MELTIQIVHYNTPGLLRETLRSIRRAAPRITYEVIVVDNNPHARLSKQFELDFPEVTFLMAPTHLGFGGAHNLAFAHAKGRNILVFNPDIYVEYGALEKLVAFLNDHDDVGLVGAQLVNPDGTLQYSCMRFSYSFARLLRRTPMRHFGFVRAIIDDVLMRDVDHSKTQDVDWMIGACLCLSREDWVRLGGFDERFKLYFEDNDLCRRVWELGKRVVYLPEVHMLHYHRREGSGGSVFIQILKRSNRLHLQSWLRYLRKYWRVPLPSACPTAKHAASTTHS